ncbi:MAG: hypothetical protein D3906_09920 [Candidatus Electrothrix sp. AUS1_2]|nr:hypothetical protein [Candidatus Electrothrix sp. AUS1_2]
MQQFFFQAYRSERREKGLGAVKARNFRNRNKKAARMGSRGENPGGAISVFFDDTEEVSA